MKTSAISSPVNLTPGNANAAKPADAEEGASFGQVLSREIAAAPKADGANAPQHKPAARAENKSAGPESGSAAAKRSEAEAAENGGSGETVNTENAKAAAGDEEQDADKTASTAADDLLALVASLTQPDAVARDAAAGQEAAGTGTGADATLLAASQPALAALAPNQSAAVQDAGIPTALANAAPASSLPATGVEPSAAGSGRMHAAAMHLLNGRTKQDAAANDDLPGTDNIATNADAAGEARIAGRTPAENANAKTVTDAASASIRSDSAFAKSLQDIQPAGAAPAGINASAPVHIQSAGIQHAQAAPGQFTDRLAPRVGTPGWDQALGQKVIWMVGGEQQSASLTLNPPDLGPLQVVLSVSENQATANFTAAQPEVRQALEAAMPKLREMLGEAGIQLGQANVNAGTPDNQHNAFAQPQHAAHGSPAQDDKPEPQARVSRVVSGGQGLVDTFA